MHFSVENIFSSEYCKCYKVLMFKTKFIESGSSCFQGQVNMLVFTFEVQSALKAKYVKLCFPAFQVLLSVPHL